MFWMISSLNLLGSGRRTKGAKFAAVGHRQGFGARELDPLEAMVRFDLLFHLGLDFLEILGRDAVRQLDIVIEAVLDRRPGGELRFGPEPQDGGRQNMGAGMADPFQLGHGWTFMGVRHIGGGDVFGD